nr:acid-sensing ion channel 2 [Parasteatoda tepidariorum]
MTFRIMRSKYCEKYPQRCEMPDDTFCLQNRDYCGDNQTTLVPKPEYRNASYDPGDVLELSHDINDLIYEYKYDFEKANETYFLEHSQTVVRRRIFGMNEYSKCFVLYSRVESSLDPPILKRNKNFFKYPYYSFIFDPMIYDAFDPIMKDGIYFSIHSPFDVANPFEKGYFMKPGRMHKITVSMTEEYLLPPPYKTDCMDYDLMWRNNNKTGPRSQDACRLKCVADVVTSCCNCTLASHNYPYSNDFPLCSENQFYACFLRCAPFEKLIAGIQICYESCKEECYYIKYTVEVQDRYIDLQKENSTIDTDIKKIYVDVSIEDTEVMSFSYKPQYQEVEAFSYIGGFIGIWLGVSLVQVTDFLENTFLLIRRCFRKRNPKKAEAFQES